MHEIERPTLTSRVRARLAALAEDVARRVRPSENARPVPDHLTGKALQAAHAQSLIQQSQRANRQGLRGRQPQPSSDGTPSSAQSAQSTQSSADVLDVLPSGTPSDELQTLMQTNDAPQATPAPTLSPAAPLPVVPGLDTSAGPRQYAYQVGSNLTMPRATEPSSAAQLRNLALLYEGVQLCEQTWFDVANRMQFVVGFDDGVIPDGESETDRKWRTLTAAAQSFIDCPDGVLSINDWMCASLRDVLELGHSAIFVQRNRAGQIISLDLVDAATIKPLVDERGRQPLPPFPAYQQWLYGMPAGDYRADEMLIVRENARTESAYSFSRVERIITRINMALRKQHLDLTRYTDGAVPEGMLFPDAETQWTPEQCELFEQHFNDLLAGNQRQRVRVKVGPPGGTFKETRSADPLIDFDRYLLNVTVAAFGLTMDEIAMTATSNRSVGDSQENVVYRRVVEPLARRYCRILTQIVREISGDERLVVRVAGFEEREDRLLKAQTLNIGVKAGAISPSYMAREMGWRVDTEVAPFIVAGSEVVALEDWQALREKRLDAQEAGLELAISNPGASAAAAAQQSSASGDESGDDAESGDSTAERDKTSTPSSSDDTRSESDDSASGDDTSSDDTSDDDDKSDDDKSTAKRWAHAYVAAEQSLAETAVPIAAQTRSKTPSHNVALRNGKRARPVRTLSADEQSAIAARASTAQVSDALSEQMRAIFDEVARSGAHKPRPR